MTQLDWRLRPGDMQIQRRFISALKGEADHRKTLADMYERTAANTEHLGIRVAFREAASFCTILADSLGRVADSLGSKNRPGFKQQPKIYSKRNKRR